MLIHDENRAQGVLALAIGPATMRPLGIDRDDRALVEQAADAIVVTERNGRILDANQAACRLTGYSRMQLLELNILETCTSEGRAAAVERLATIAEGGTELVERRLRRHDGSEVTVELSLTCLTDGRLEGILRDITVRKRVEADACRMTQADRSALEQQFRQAQKMEAVGRLAGGVAHDFNNILTVIRGYTELLRQDLAPGHRSLDDVNEIRAAADRAAGLTRQLLAFSRKQVFDSRVLDLNELLRNLEKMLHRLLGDDTELVTRLDPALWTVKADPGQLEQVVMNLAVNARDAMVTGGRLEIETRNALIDRRFADEHRGMAPGEFAAFVVRDNGAGMDELTRARLFEPFFTTKERGKGTGLGLSTVYGIVKQSGGYIDVESQPGRGATFTVYLPRVAGAVEPVAQPPAAAAPARGTATILLVDDDDGVRQIVNQTLTRSGYHVVAVGNGSDAIRAAESWPAPIDLMITDIVMPDVNGFDLAEHLRSSRPSMRRLFMSGYTDDEMLRRGMLERSRDLLRKPFDPGTLLARVHDVLAGA